MGVAAQSIVLVPVTEAQARLFGGIARLLVRRGVECRLVAASPGVGEALSDEWGPLLTVVDHTQPATGDRLGGLPAGLGSYDAWRLNWSAERLAAEQARAVQFWREYLAARPESTAIVVWNGRDDLFAESAGCAFGAAGRDVLALELGALRARPMTLAVSRHGVNAAAVFRRGELLERPLSAREGQRLGDARSRFGAPVRPFPHERPHAFMPLQVDDDTQLFHYAPHFGDQVEAVRAIIAALPADVPLLLKLHPLSDERLGRSRYAGLLRPGDAFVPPATDTLGLIAGARATITTNSSAAIEALLLDRPVVLLGLAHCRGRGFTWDYQPGVDLPALLRAALAGRQTDSGLARRERYLYELLFQELVWLEHHPLREPLAEEELDRVAVRVLDLLDPALAGSDWTPVFAEAAALRATLTAAVRRARAERPDAALLLSRHAAAVLDAELSIGAAILEDVGAEGAVRGAQGATRAQVLAPDWSPGARAVVLDQLRQTGVATVDLTTALSRQPCRAFVDRFNALPQALRDTVYAQCEYWDAYLTHSGLSPENSPAKATQGARIAQRIAALRPRTVLEYGCGDARILEALVAALPAATFTGVDSSERMLTLARRRLGAGSPVTLELADAAERTRFADQEFDVTVTCGALQHIPAERLETVLEDLHRVTRRALVHWETWCGHAPTPGEHYTHAATSETIQRAVLRRFGPVALRVDDVHAWTGQRSLLTQYELTRPEATVLTLHAIGTPDAGCDLFDYRNMFVTRAALAALVDELLAAGFRFVTPGELSTAPGPKRIVLTFDDAYESVYREALPVLAARGIRATVFVPTGFVGGRFGGNPRGGAGPDLPVMSVEQLRTLWDAGWTIGAHSVSHPVFAQLDDEAARRELTQSRAQLADWLGAAPADFAFPYGEPGLAYQPRHVALARAAGFQRVHAMRPGFVNAESIASGEWPRIGVGGDTPPGQILDELARVQRSAAGWPAPPATATRSLPERVRRAVRECVARGRQRVAVYGAGQHTARLLAAAPLWPLQVLGIVDDDAALAGRRRYGLPVYALGDAAGLGVDALLISSDRYEEAMFERAAPLVRHGIDVVRLYAEG